MPLQRPTGGSSLFEILLLIIFLALIGWALLSGKKKAKARAIANRAKGEDFLVENGQLEDVITTLSGLQFQLLHQGQGGQSPAASDRVKVHYHGTLINGKVFDSSVDRGEPISFGLNQVIEGWTEGLQMMTVGDKARLVIPSQLGYGDHAVGGIPAGSVLIFDVELLAINDD